MAKIHIKTFGCSSNYADSEIIAGILIKAGFEIIDDIDSSDLVIVNTCTVKGPTENKIIAYIDKLKLSKKVIVAGCIPQTDPEKLKDVSMIGTHQIQNIVEIVEETLNDTFVTLVVEDTISKLELPKKRLNPYIEIIPISQGCLGNCTYCKTKFARGNLSSYPINQILSAVKLAISEGVYEIWLTSQDNSCYGKDLNTNLAELLNKITAIPGTFKVRVGMMNPNHVLEILPELISAYKNDKIYKFLHLPLQSGSDDILKKMNRKYTVSEFEKIIFEFKKNILDITIATDIIVGFPTETDEQFSMSVNLIKRISPDVLNISRYWPRTKTIAEKMEQVDDLEKKIRSNLMTFLYNNISTLKNEKWHNWSGEVFVSEIGKDGSYVGRNYAYKPVVINSKNNLMGKILFVQVKNTTIHDLRADVLKIT